MCSDNPPGARACFLPRAHPPRQAGMEALRLQIVGLQADFAGFRATGEARGQNPGDRSVRVGTDGRDLTSLGSSKCAKQLIFGLGLSHQHACRSGWKHIDHIGSLHEFTICVCVCQ